MGTLFLDEAGEMSQSVQAKLLRRADRPAGGARWLAHAAAGGWARWIFATHRDLPQRVKDGQFREDLYYRIAVVPIEMPPLRDRREDIALLVDRFLADAAIELKVPQRRIDPAALRKLQGRMRSRGTFGELRNLIEGACTRPGRVHRAGRFPAWAGGEI